MEKRTLSEVSELDLVQELCSRGYHFSLAPGQSYQLMLGRDKSLSRSRRILLLVPCGSVLDEPAKPKNKGKAKRRT